MKRFFAALLALVMILSLSITAFAEERNVIGSITITNATPGQFYTLYKIFDASVRYEKDAEGNYVMENGEYKVESLSYDIDPEDDFFAYMFENPEYESEGEYYNPFFLYNPNSTTGNVVVKDDASHAAIIEYLTEMVSKPGAEFIERVEFTLQNEDDDDLGNNDDLVFSDLEPGYYLVVSSLGSAVTINSNTPHVKIIDKNQVPGTELDKQVQTGVDAQGNPTWGDSNSANLGDTFQYKISIDTANYDGDKKIMYYQIHDEKGDSLWVEFDSIRVFVGEKELPRGYYLAVGGDNTDNWEYLGNKEHADGWNTYGGNKNINDAQWYLVHLSYDKFRITIPWLENHELVATAEGETTYSLSFAADAESIYPSPSQIVVTYDVGVEGNAAVGNTSHGNRFNKAKGSYTSEYETYNTETDEVITYVYGLGILKDDLTGRMNLPGAKFVVYRDYDEQNKEYLNPVAVIPTGIQGVFAVDSNGTGLEEFSGQMKENTRTYYQYLRYADGTHILDENNQKIPNAALAAQGNSTVTEMVTPANGKLVVLGLAAGDYYVVETEAPEGYNAVAGHVLMTVGEGSRDFDVYADKNGNVADIQTENSTYKEFTYNVTQAVIHNSKGATLPSTGGEGRIMLITIGTMVAIGFAVLLITQKKMSIYND